MITKTLIYLIRLYQIYVTKKLPTKCRFQPSCSEYSIMAIEKYGSIKGIAKGLHRLIRCNPFNYNTTIDYP